MRLPGTRTTRWSSRDTRISAHSRKLALAAFAVALLMAPSARAAPMTGPLSVIMAPSVPPVPTATPAPGPAPAPPAAPDTLAVAEEALPSKFNLRNDAIGHYVPAGLSLPAQRGYSEIPGVLTFRGGPYRQNAAYGYATAPKGKLEVVWANKIGGLDNWGGVGWNGQPALVQWPESLRRVMNLYDGVKEKEGLIEVIYCTLDGNIYFWDIEDGTPTRDKIKVGYPMKGSVSIDPRGVPLLYSGQGVSTANGKAGPIGLRIFSLVTGDELFRVPGITDDAYRRHGAFDSVCLVDAVTDTLIAPAENGLINTYKLNTVFDPVTGALSISPEKGGYRYRNNRGLGTENSMAVYGYYGYFADNGGLLQCVDLRTLKPVWAADVTDDTDASVALDPRPDGHVLLYTGCEVDLQKKGGKAYLRCFDALTGSLRWEVAEPCVWDDFLNGGLLASPLVGEGPLDSIVFFHVAKNLPSGGGVLLALDKETGEAVWRRELPHYGWSSPVAVYGAEGEAHLILGDCMGNLRLFDARSGEILDTLRLTGNIEGSPAVFGDILVVGTRGRQVYGVRIR